MSDQDYVNQGIQLMSGSSLGNGRQRRNPDGTIVVHCPQCGRRICDIDGRNSFFVATCILCQKAEEGVLLPKDIEEQIKTTRMPDGREVSRLTLFGPPPDDPMLTTDKEKDLNVNRSGYWFKAIVGAAKKIIKKKKVDKKEEEVFTSAGYAKEHRHKPLLAGGLEINKKQKE